MSHLAGRLAQGNSAAFAELYDLCSDRLHHFLVSKRMSQDDASDVLQEVFLRLVRKKGAFRSVESPVAYTFQVARNEANRWISKSIQKREQYQLIAADLFVGFASTDSSSTEWSETLIKALVSLPDDQREVVVLRIDSGFTFREIAAITETPQGTVATRYRRGIEKLREIIGELE